MKKNIVFDYDGTLHETIRIYAPAFRMNYRILVEQGLAAPREFTDDEIGRWLGYTAADMWNAFAPQLSAEEKAACSTRIQNEMQRLTLNGTAQLYPGIPDIMDRLKAQGYGIWFLSNCKNGYLEAHRKRFGLDRWFDGYYWAEAENWATKTEILMKILHEHPGDAVMVGDRFIDIDAGNACGIPTIATAYGYGVPEEYKSASAIAETPSELFSCITRIAGPAVRP